MTAPSAGTLEHAVLTLANNKQFRTADIGPGHGAAARIRVGVPLSGESQRRMYRLLAAYRTELAGHGIDYNTLPVPPEAGSPADRPTNGNGGWKKPIGRTRVWVDGGHLWMKSPFEARQIVRDRIPSAVWQKSRVAYKLPATPAAALSIADALGSYGVDADEAATELVKKAHVAKGAQAKRAALDLPPVPGSKTEAWNHQRQAFWFARELPGAVLDVEMGGGKSKIMCDLVHDSGAESVLIVCPERVIGVWPKQFGIHCGGDKHIIDPRRQNRRGEWSLIPIKERVALYEHALHECTCGLPHVILSNYAAAGHEPFKSWSLRQRLDYVCYDEVHRLRSPGGVWSKWAAKMHSRAERRLGGTGTLQSQTPLDVFGQFRAIEPGIFGSTYIGFEKRYAIKGGYEGKVVVGYQNEDELAEKIATITFHAGEEVLDLPELLPDTDVVGRLTPKAMKAYKEFEDDMYAEVARTLDSGVQVLDEATADNALVKMLRCMQMTGGHLQLDSGVLEEIDTAKRDLLLDELEDIPPDEPVVVFCKFIPDLDSVRWVAEKLKRPYAELSGRRSDALAADATLAEGCTVAGVQIQAGGTGVDFTRACYGYYFSVGHSLGDFLQSRKRLHRPGQTRAVRFRHLVMEGTIDTDVYESLAENKSITQRITEKVRAIQSRKAG